MVEQVVGGNARIDPEILRQVAEPLAQFLGLLENVDPVEGYAARSRGLQRRHGPHQGGFAGAVRAEQSEHALGDGQGHIVERARTVRIDMGNVLQFQHSGSPLCLERSYGCAECV